MLRGTSCLVLPCSLSMCFWPFSILVTLLGEEGAALCAYRAFVCWLCTCYSVSLFLFILVSGLGCDFCLWLFLNFSVYLFVPQQISKVPSFRRSLALRIKVVIFAAIQTCYGVSMVSYYAIMESCVWFTDELAEEFRMTLHSVLWHYCWCIFTEFNWTASSEFGTYRLCEQRRFRRACASAQSRQNLRCSLIQALSQEEPSDRKPDP